MSTGSRLQSAAGVSSPRSGGVVVGMYASNPVMSSDEAPDTGDDSDEDVITSYLMQHGNTSSVNVAGSAATSNAGGSGNVTAINTDTPILEDNLLQLSRIQDKIQ